MLFALSTSHKIGLAGVGCFFIAYSLISAFILPARWPNFPGRYLIPYVGLSIVVFFAMMGAVMVFGREQGEAHAAVEKVAPTETTTTTTATSPTSPTAGDVVAGKTVYTSSGCGACHTFTPAGSSGTVGPDLDHLAEYAAKAGQPIEDFTKSAISTPPAAYVPPPFPTNVMQPDGGVTLTPKQLDDLVAFLVKPQ